MSGLFAIAFYLEFSLRDASCHSYYGLEQNTFVMRDLALQSSRTLKKFNFTGFFWQRS